MECVLARSVEGPDEALRSNSPSSSILRTVLLWFYYFCCCCCCCCYYRCCSWLWLQRPESRMKSKPLCRRRGSCIAVEDGGAADKSRKLAPRWSERRPGGSLESYKYQHSYYDIRIVSYYCCWCCFGIVADRLYFCLMGVAQLALM